MSSNNKETEFNPLSNVLYSKKNQSNILDILDILDKKNLLRANYSFYLSTNLTVSWRHYCRISGKSTCWLLEEAILEYMKNHQLPTSPLIVTQDMRNHIPNYKIETKMILVKQQLKEAIKFITNSNNASQRNKLNRVLIKALNLNTSDPELQDLIKEGRRFFE